MNFGRKVAGGLVAFVICVAVGVAGAMPALEDQEITDAVESQILLDPAVSLNTVHVATTNGIVRLKGTVLDLLARERAVRIAETVRGVRSVVNEIVVHPLTPRSDGEIARDIRDDLLYDRATEAFEIDVAVDEGIAKLSGEVGSWQESMLAEQVASGVHGVRLVRNELTIDYDDPRTALEVEPEIRSLLRNDVRIDGALVAVAFADGKVTLTGVVGSAAEKRQARNTAWVRGVTEVDASGLKVKRWARDEDLRAEKYVARSDEEVRAAVEDAMLYDPRVFSFEVSVSASNGFVTLRGVVDNLKARRAAETDARNTVGVSGVRNHIRVAADAASDARLATRVSDALLWDPRIDGSEVSVDVTNGVVRLKGEVDTWYQKACADELASRAHGVVDVRNLLDVRFDHKPMVFSPHIDPFDHWFYDWYAYRPGLAHADDVAVESEIEHEILWSPYVDLEDIEVSVKAGVATLTGEVDSLSEKRFATKNALEGGATWVENHLEVGNK